MSHIYYQEIIDEEHRLYASEISRAYKITSITGNPHPNLINAIIDEYYKDKGESITKLHYWGSHGMTVVYSFSQYDPAMQWFLEMIHRNQLADIKLNGTLYKFKYLGPKLF